MERVASTRVRMPTKTKPRAAGASWTRYQDRSPQLERFLPIKMEQQGSRRQHLNLVDRALFHGAPYVVTARWGGCLGDSSSWSWAPIGHFSLVPVEATIHTGIWSQGNSLWDNRLKRSTLPVAEEMPCLAVKTWL